MVMLFAISRVSSKRCFPLRFFIISTRFPLIRSLWWVSVNTEDFKIRTESGDHVPRELLVLHELRPNSTVYFAAV